MPTQLHAADALQILDTLGVTLAESVFHGASGKSIRMIVGGSNKRVPAIVYSRGTNTWKCLAETGASLIGADSVPRFEPVEQGVEALTLGPYRLQNFFCKRYDQRSFNNARNAHCTDASDYRPRTALAKLVSLPELLPGLCPYLGLWTLRPAFGFGLPALTMGSFTPFS